MALRKVIVALLALITAVLCLSPMAYAENNEAFYEGSVVYDYADLLTDAEEKTVNKALLKAAKRNEMIVAIVTTDDKALNSEAATEQYGDKFFDEKFTELKSGALLVVNMTDRYADIILNGKADDKYDSRADGMVNKITAKLAEAKYKAAFVTFAKGFDINWTMIIIVSIIVVAILVIVMFVIAGSYKLHSSVSARAYAFDNNITYRVKTDNYIRTYTTKQKIQSSSSGGRSGGGGGRSHHGGHF